MGKSAILITHDVLRNVIADAAKYAGRKERGGILLGFRRGPHLDIDEATLPTRWDRGSLFSFRRSSRGHQAAALRRWQRSQQTADWLGEWHSHPESHPTPSSIDLATWREIARYRGDAMVFLIIGYDGLWLGLVRPGQHTPVRYVEVEESALGKAFLPTR